MDDATKQSIASEMNLSETAFVVAPEDGDEDPFATGSSFGLRWFTPRTEVPLCGHATLASAATIFMCTGNRNVRVFIVHVFFRNGGAIFRMATAKGFGKL